MLSSHLLNDRPEIRLLAPEGAWPSLSPAGDRVVYACGLDDDEGWLAVLELAPGPPGGEAAAPATTSRRITPPGLDASRPTWSWSPSTIAFSGGDGRIWTIESDGGEPSCDLPPPPAGWGFFHPSWYPDLESLVAVAIRQGAAGSERVLFRLWCRPRPSDPGGRRLEPLTGYPELCAGRPGVAPDGRSVVFAGNAGGCDQAHNQLWVLTPPAPPRRLEPDRPGVPRGTWQGRAPSWSPDGRWIAFVSNRLGDGSAADSAAPASPKAIWVVPAAGGRAERLTDELLTPSHVEWSRDQRRLVFGGFRGGVGLVELPERFGRRRDRGAEGG